MAYTNTNYNLLGLIVERVSGMSYGRFLRRNIFRPLGMDSSMPLVGGISGDPAHPDNIIYDITPTPGGGLLDPVGTLSQSAGDFGHPMCSPATPNPNTLPAVQTP